MRTKFRFMFLLFYLFSLIPVLLFFFSKTKTFKTVGVLSRIFFLLLGKPKKEKHTQSIYKISNEGKSIAVRIKNMVKSSMIFCCVDGKNFTFSGIQTNRWTQNWWPTCCCWCWTRSNSQRMATKTIRYVFI